MLKDKLLSYLKSTLQYTEQPENQEPQPQPPQEPQEDNSQEQPPQEPQDNSQQPQEDNLQEQPPQPQEEPQQQEPQPQEPQDNSQEQSQEELQQEQSPQQEQSSQQQPLSDMASPQESIQEQQSSPQSSPQETSDDMASPEQQSQEAQSQEEQSQEQPQEEQASPQEDFKGEYSLQEDNSQEQHSDSKSYGDLSDALSDIYENCEEDLYDDEYYDNLIQSIKSFSDASSIVDKLKGDDVNLEVKCDKKVSPKWWYDVSKLLKSLKPLDNSYKRLNKKYLHSGIILPSRSASRKKVGEVTECHIYLDVSSSMSITDLNIAMSTLNLTRKYFPNKVKLFYFNHSLKQVDVSNIFKKKISGSGGTDIIPVVEHIIKEDKKAKNDRILNIVISDGGFDERPVQALYKSASTKIITVFLITSSFLSKRLLGIKSTNCKLYVATDSDVVNWTVSKKLLEEVHKRYE